MSALLAPLSTVNRRFLVWLVVSLLVVSGTFVLVATAAMPEPYSWRTHSISESAAQGLLNAWIARFSFLCFGGAVLVLSILQREVWARSTYWMHLAFAVAMLSTAAFSHKPWIADVPVDEFEDFLHSVAASGMGFAFCFGVIARFLQRGRNELVARTLDVIAVVVATTMSPLAAWLPNNGGFIQRVMFAVAYVWYANEALSSVGMSVNPK
jgi:sulfite exporter TauE/SafE